MKNGLLIAASLVAGMSLAPLVLSPRASIAGDALAPLALLRQGNERFAAGELAHAHQSVERRSEIARGERPFAAIVGCADSCVPPELVFDQGLGDLYVVRSAGNALDDAALGSIEYAVQRLGSKLVVVLGHERCGALEAVLQGGELAGHQAALAAALRPSATAARKLGGDPLDQAVRLNALRIAAELRASDAILAERVRAGELLIVAARYDVDTGEVEWLDAPDEPAAPAGD